MIRLYSCNIVSRVSMTGKCIQMLQVSVIPLYIKHGQRGVKSCGSSIVLLSLRLCSRECVYGGEVGSEGVQRAGERRVVTMGSVQEWRWRGCIQEAATQLLINSCENQRKDAFLSLEEKKRKIFSLHTIYLFSEIRKRLKSGP